jgi:T5SS/PEP-CTERM-associated repeat protein
VKVSTLVIGELGGGDGAVHIEDPGSNLEARFAVVGALGKGLLNVFSGGTATIGRLTVNNGIVRGNVAIGSTTPKMDAAFSMGADSALGSISVDTLILNEGATIEADSITFAGGVLGGTGVFPFDVVNTGTIAPGDAAFSTGVFTVGAGFTQTSEGVLEIELGGPGGSDANDRLVVADTARLGGLLRVTVLTGTPSPIVGNTYTIMTASEVNGQFDTIELQEGLAATVGYGATEVALTVTDFVNVATEGTSPNEIPSEITLQQNYPNPFNPTTRIKYGLPESAQVRVTIYNVLGQLVSTIIDKDQAAGYYEVNWDARTGAGAMLPSGLYFYRVETKNFLATRSMVFQK